MHIYCYTISLAVTQRNFNLQEDEFGYTLLDLMIKCACATPPRFPHEREKRQTYGQAHRRS
jgi:hypothetical protein